MTVLKWIVIKTWGYFIIIVTVSSIMIPSMLREQCETTNKPKKIIVFNDIDPFADLPNLIRYIPIFHFYSLNREVEM